MYPLSVIITPLPAEFLVSFVAKIDKLGCFNFDIPTIAFVALVINS